MTITEATRYRMHEGLIGNLGEEVATTLMEHLPPVGWAEVATKVDLEHVRVATKTEIDRLRGDMDARFNAVDARFNSVDAKMEAGFGSLRGDMDARFNAVDARFNAVNERFNALGDHFDAALAKSFSTQMRWVVGTMIAFYAIFGVLLSVWR